MWPDVTDQYLEAVRYNHDKLVRATHVDLFTTTSTPLGYVGRDTGGSDAPPLILGGAVTVDGTSNVRRKLDMTLPPQQALWDALDTVGGEMAVFRGLKYANGDVEWIPVGVFTIDTDSMDYGTGGPITISGAPDRWGKVQKSMLPPTGRASVRTNAAWQEIQRLVEGAWSTAFPFPGWAKLDKSATAKVGGLVWDDGDREAAILKLCTDNAVEVFFDAAGKAVLQPVPQLTDTSTPVFTINAGDDAVLLGAERSRDRTRAYNVIIVNNSATSFVFNPVEVKNTVASDPLNVNGPLGYHAVEYSSPSLQSSAQALAAGKALLSKSVGVAKQLSLTAIGNDALDAGDVIEVVLPRTDVNLDRPTELHIIDTLTIPFDPQGAMEIQTRSTVPATLGA